jgi:hypothetical protein
MSNIIQQTIENLFNNTPDNIHSVGLGDKYINGIRTDQTAIVFDVLQKKPLSELDPNEVLPTSINIDGITYPTDVIEKPELAQMLVCYSNADDNEILRLRGSTAAGLLNPLRGGQELVEFPTGWTYANGIDGSAGYNIKVGTLGFFAVDNIDNYIVGVTNAHVSINNPYLASDRNIVSESSNPFNIKETRTWLPDGNSYNPGHLSFDGTLGNIRVTSTRIKRYSPFKMTEFNYADSALLFMNNNRVNNFSYRTHFPTTSADYTDYMPFASTAEIDSLFTVGSTPSSRPRLLSVGRTTGPKGWASSNACSMVAVSTSVTLNVNFSGTIVPFSDTIGFQYLDNSAGGPILGGDSGSVVMAVIGGVRKIVGLAFAGDTVTGYLCRIDRIASAMNIRAWDGSYVVPANPTGNPYIVGQTVPANPVREDVVVCDINDPRSSQTSIVYSGRTYYQAGCTNQSGYTPLP